MKDNMMETRMETSERQPVLNRVEMRTFVSENAKKILEEAGILLDKEIVAKEIRGDDQNSVFHIYCDDFSYALKVFSNREDAGLFYTNLKFNRLANNEDVPTPQIIHSSDDCQLLSAPYILWEWFSGRPSCEIESVPDRLGAAIQTGTQLRKMHGVKLLGFGYPDTDNGWVGINAQWTTDFFTRRIRSLTEKGGVAFSESELLKIISVTAESKELLSFTNPRLLHGDITGGNVLVSNSKNITFIDPGEIIAGDPMSDLGYSQVTRLSPIFREGVWKGYIEEARLTNSEYDRFLRWRLLRQCVIACRAFLNKDKNANNYISATRLFLDKMSK